MTIGLVWAQAHDRVIGRDNGIPWHIPEDLKHFKAITGTSRVVMGRRTWESLPERFRPLPGRENVVVTGNASYDAPGATLASSLDEALSGDDDVWVIGGANVYAEAIDRADVLELFRSVGLSESHARRLPAGPSGGQLQRVALVRALVSQPSVLVCDEVTTALDTDHAAAVVDRIDAYRRETGAAVLLISHDEAVLTRIADRVVGIRDAGGDAGLPDRFLGREDGALLSEGRPPLVPHDPAPSLRKGTP